MGSPVPTTIQRIDRRVGEGLERLVRDHHRRRLRRLLRTLPDKTYAFAPRGDFRILEAYARALRGAERLVYLATPASR